MKLYTKVVKIMLEKVDSQDVLSQQKEMQLKAMMKLFLLCGSRHRIQELHLLMSIR